MNRAEVIRHLSKHGCAFLREGRKHSIYVNPANGKTAAVRRHQFIALGTVRGICEDLEIPMLRSR